MFRWKIAVTAVIISLTSMLAHIFSGGADTLHPVDLFREGTVFRSGGVIGGWLGVLFVRK